MVGVPSGEERSRDHNQAQNRLEGGGDLVLNLVLFMRFNHIFLRLRKNGEFTGLLEIWNFFYERPFGVFCSSSRNLIWTSRTGIVYAFFGFLLQYLDFRTLD